MNLHNHCCLFRCSGKSPASSCWPSSSVSLFWDWLSVSYFYQVHFSFTTHVKQHVGLDTVHCCKGFFVHLIMCLTENLFCFYIVLFYIVILFFFYLLHVSGHLESKSSIKRVLAITAVLSLGYSITQVMTRRL